MIDHDLAHKQYNGIIKEWLHCLTPESIGTFLVNNTGKNVANSSVNV